MSDSFFKVWAVAATAVALVLLGIVLGRYIDGGGIEATPASHDGYTSIDTGLEDTPTNVVDAFQVPESLVGLAREWRSTLDSETDFDGHVVLFDTQRREMIVEQCQHPGYFDRREGKPINGNTDFCRALVWGSVTEITEEEVKVIDRTGKLVEIDWILGEANGNALLKLKFEDQSLSLVTGSRNDLYQQMDRSPEMSEQKQLSFAYEQEQMKKRLLAQQSDSVEAEPDIPRYTLPEKSEQRRND